VVWVIFFAVAFGASFVAFGAVFVDFGAFDRGFETVAFLGPGLAFDFGF
jgi:hypothetical protein